MKTFLEKTKRLTFWKRTWRLQVAITYTERSRDSLDYTISFQTFSALYMYLLYHFFSVVS